MNPPSPEFSTRLKELRQLIQAEHFSRAANLGMELSREAPDQPRVWGLLARAHERGGNYGLSLMALERFVQLQPDQIDAQASLVRGNLIMGRSQQVIDEQKRLEELLLKHPTSDPEKYRRRSTIDLAESYLRLGRTDKAREHLDSLASRGAKGPRIMLVHAMSDMADRNHELAAPKLKALIENRNFPKGIRIQAQFQLAKILDRDGRYDEAFRLVAEVKSDPDIDFAPFDRDAFRTMTDRLIAVFSRERMQAMQTSGLGSQRPVFVVGMPRSGTTLTEQIISAHSQCSGIGESREPIVFTQLLAEQMGGDFPECAAGAPSELLQVYGSAYLEMIDHYVPGVERVTNKALGLERILGLLPMILPGSRVVFVTRNPLDNVLSTYMHSLNHRHYPWARTLEDIALVRMEFDRLLAHWREHLDLPMFDFEYDRVTNDPEPVIRGLIEFLGLPFEEECLRFHEQKRLVMTPSFDQVDKPINREAVDRWKNYESQLEKVAGMFDT